MTHLCLACLRSFSPGKILYCPYCLSAYVESWDRMNDLRPRTSATALYITVEIPR